MVLAYPERAKSGCYLSLLYNRRATDAGPSIPAIYRSPFDAFITFYDGVNAPSHEHGRIQYG